MARPIAKECQVSRIPERLGITKGKINLIAFDDILGHVRPECYNWILDEEIISVMRNMALPTCFPPNLSSKHFEIFCPQISKVRAKANY